jgi:hypothetical protein
MVVFAETSICQVMGRVTGDFILEYLRELEIIENMVSLLRTWCHEIGDSVMFDGDDAICRYLHKLHLRV